MFGSAVIPGAKRSRILELICSPLKELNYVDLTKETIKQTAEIYQQENAIL